MGTTSKGADVNIKDNGGKSPLAVASIYLRERQNIPAEKARYERIISFLKEHGAKE
jgi:hypothetical protein